jgi:hypothetical protein
LQRDDLRGPSGAPHPAPRDSRQFGAVKQRPLELKIAQLLDVMFRWLDWDPSTKVELEPGRNRHIVVNTLQSTHCKPAFLELHAQPSDILMPRI